MKKLPIITGFLALMATAQLSVAQTVNEYLNAYLGQNKEGYLQPLALMSSWASWMRALPVNI